MLKKELILFLIMQTLNTCKNTKVITDYILIIIQLFTYLLSFKSNKQNYIGW